MTDEQLKRIGDALLDMSKMFDELETSLLEALGKVAEMRASYEDATALVMAEIYGHDE